MGDRCTGRCCRGFYLGSYGDLQRRAAAGDKEAVFILDMVGPHPPEYRGPFSCRHVGENGDCAVYDQRPRMCRVYPQGEACGFGDECEWDDARKGRVDKEGQPACKNLVFPQHLSIGKGLTPQQLWRLNSRLRVDRIPAEG